MSPGLKRAAQIAWTASSVYTGYHIATKRRFPQWMVWFEGVEPPAWLGVLWAAMAAQATVALLLAEKPPEAYRGADCGGPDGRV